MSLANDFADIEPANNFDSNEGVEPCLSDGNVLPVAVLGSPKQIAEAAEDLRNLSRGWWIQFGFSKSVELAKFWFRR